MHVATGLLRGQVKETQHKAGLGGFPGGPVVKNPPCNAGDTGLSPGRGTKVPHAAEQQSLRPQLESPCTKTKAPVRHNKSPHVAIKT